MKQEKQTFNIKNFILEITPVINEPGISDFKDPESGSALQCGADVHICYPLNPFSRYEKDLTLRMLQCVKSKGREIPNIKDAVTEIRIDHRAEKSGILKNQLYGNSGDMIQCTNPEINNKPVTTECIDECNIYDIPREIYSYNNMCLVNDPIELIFWDYVAGVNKQGYTYVKKDGIKWTITIRQKYDGITPLNDYEVDVHAETTQISKDIPWKVLFEGMDNTYKIVD